MSNLFFPHIPSNELTTERYITDLIGGKFSDRMFLGIIDTDGGKLLMKNFEDDANALFAGKMGSGKSYGCMCTATTWMAANGHKSIMFIVDLIKSAGDYQHLFKLPNVYTAINSPADGDFEEKARRMIDLGYSELTERSKMFADAGVAKLSQYESKTGKELARVVFVIEEVYSLFALIEFEKEYTKNFTLAQKLFKMLKTGRSVGIWFLAASQKSTSSDIPPSIISGLINKMMFSVTQAESSYVLGNDTAFKLKTHEKGRCCYSEIPFSKVQFPALDRKDAEALTDKFCKPLSANCSYLSDGIIRLYLSGKNPKELYLKKGAEDIVQSIKSLKGEAAVNVLHEKMGHQWIDVDSRLDMFGTCGVATFKDGKRYVILYESGDKLGLKRVFNLSLSIKKQGADGGIVYFSANGIPKAVSDFCRNNGNIIIFDHEDMLTLSRQVDAKKFDLANVFFDHKFDTINSGVEVPEDEELTIKSELTAVAEFELVEHKKKLNKNPAEKFKGKGKRP